MADNMDVRIRERNLRKGRISRTEVETYLSKLTDKANAVEYVDYERQFEEEKRAAEAAEAAEAAAYSPFGSRSQDPPVPSPAEGGPAVPLSHTHQPD
jgi:hypothetical protein